MPKQSTQRETATFVLEMSGIARLADLRAAGVTAATISRMERAGEVVRLGRGLYQLSNAPLSADHALAEAAKAAPRGIVCLVSALAFHGLTDQLPRHVWLAIGQRDWSPRRPELKTVRFADRLLRDSIETHIIEDVPVQIFGIAKTIADCFRHRRTVGLAIAIEGLQEALRQSKASPAEIARHAERGDVATVMRPYLEALTANG
jgi:predicted transcriptional regulator of viral defense system